jgi:ankyrin repeat protein
MPNADSAPLFAAILAEDSELVKKLVKKPFDKDARDDAGHSLVEAACLKREVISAQELIKAGAPAAISAAVAKKLDAIAEPGTIGVLDDALYYSLEDVALALIEGGVDVDASGNEGYTPLIRAALQGLDAVITALLARGAKIEGTNNRGRTALWAAVSKGRVRATKLLLEAGANPNLSHDGKTLHDLAAAKPKLLALVEAAQGGGKAKKK